MDYKNISTKTLPIYNPLNINSFQFDYVIISVLGRENEITKYLVDDLGIDRNKIITLKFKNV